MLCAYSPIFLNNVEMQRCIVLFAVTLISRVRWGGATDANRCYIMKQIRRREVCGCDKCVGGKHTHTTTALTSSSAAMWSHNAAIQKLLIQKNVRDRERNCLFGVMLLLFFTSLPRHNIFLGPDAQTQCDTCGFNLLSFTGSAYMLSLQQMSPCGICSLNRIFHQRQSQN